MPHLPAAYNLARWLTRNGHDADDVVQEACLRAFRAFDGFRGGDPRAWLLTIVRNTCYRWLKQNRTAEAPLGIREDETEAAAEAVRDPSPGPEALLLRDIDARKLHQAIADLRCELREVLVLRELEGLSYKEIADIVDVPLGTVMSRLSRARGQLQCSLRKEPERDVR